MESITITNPDAWLLKQLADGWSLVETLRHNDEPIFDENGCQLDIVNVIEHHFDDAEGNYCGVLRIVIGDDYTNADFTEFAWSF